MLDKDQQYFKNTLACRELLKKYRDRMANEPHAVWLNPIIILLNEQIEKQENEINAAIKSGKVSVKDVFLYLDYAIKEQK